ncbi:MAG: phosphatase PAP2 family protein [Anaerolineaceae bacterium]|nr:phosphatase PAP2 family protein [Anaerolineaceae bacterium]
MDETLSLTYRLGILALTLVGWLTIFFVVNRRQVDINRRIDMGTDLDKRFPFIPQFAIIYFSTYFFVVQPFFVLSDPQLFYWMLASFATISLGSSLIHAILPSKIERVENLSTNNLSGKMLHLFQKTSRPYGNFPSMHVGLSVPVVAVNYMSGNAAMGFITLIWGVLIAVSTLYTKQHYLLDVLAGLLSGAIVLLIAYFLIMVP